MIKVAMFLMMAITVLAGCLKDEMLMSAQGIQTVPLRQENRPHAQMP